MKQRWKCYCAYDGTDFLGWQSQAGGDTIQDIIESRLEAIFKEPIRIHGSGRTDSGVHARAQVFHFDADWPYESGALLRAFASGLPASIQVFSAEIASGDFHARYSAKGKRYAYYCELGQTSPFDARYTWSLYKVHPDVEQMNTAAQKLLGRRDFTALGANRADGSKDNPMKNLRVLRFEQAGTRLRLVTEGSGYLYKMVRALMGTLLNVGLGKLSIEGLVEILQTKERTPLVHTAPAHGLFLEKVFYDE
ncbi:MAG TPA: tRNA pseudouridine(38-40) synthase TruA [Opitutae bacterium]|nr:tRNA pseudouridine(38-40) synthase TruA [Opitutae bacterium]|tara:strand:- start:80 stop:829 length:750 start_codon:yes stop_codon:yes gene_type:complete